MAIVKVENLSFKYDRYILKDISFEIEKGSFISLLGINGAGKSTLLKNLNNVLEPTGGKIFLDGMDLKKISNREMARNMAYISQYNQPIKNTVYDTILIGRVPFINQSIGEEDHARVEDIIKKLDLEEYAMKDTTRLSGGEFQKVILARALAQDPKLILLDEPTSNLDIKNQVDVMKLVKSYCREKNISVLVSIHDINLALQFSDKFLLLKDGEIYAYGDQRKITKESIRDVYNIDVDISYYGERKIVILK